MMEEVEQDWRQHYDACYERPPTAVAATATAPVNTSQTRTYEGALDQSSAMQSYSSASKLVPSKRNRSVGTILGNDSSTIILRSLALLVIGALCLTLMTLIVVNASGSERDRSSGDRKPVAAEEGSPQDAPGLPQAATTPRPAATPVARSQAKTRNQRTHSKQANNTSGKKDNLSTEDKDGGGGSEDTQKNSPCGEPQQTYCPEIKLSFFYRHERDYCDSTYREQVFVCNHSPNRFSSRKGCMNACIKNAKPFARCKQQPIFTKCNRNDVKASYWYREGKRCVEWAYPDGYCATKHRGVARSLRECRDECLGPGTNDHSCTLPAEYTCPPEELKYPYFAHTFSNGTVACLVADKELLRQHRCLVGENKYASRDECRKACSKNAEPPDDSGKH
ncbi:uncharacterized protein [Dermacentor albipictus]|uniref:uncharacterized protein n=1 Tax=Dermacentor albipictus TaxID=60249 RepID=UPI0031FE2733